MPYECDGDDNERRWRAGASAGGFRTTIDFGDQKVDIEQVTASGGLFASERKQQRISLHGLINF